MPFINPVNSSYLSSKFGWRDLGFGDEWHQGVDLSTSVKRNVPVMAAADGVVVRVGPLDSYGNVVIIKHNFNGEHLETNYAHLANGSIKVNKGDRVTQGQVIGIMGATGRSFGVHLHFEIHKGPWVKGQRNAVDPAKYVKFYTEKEVQKMQAELKRAQETINKQTEEIEQLKKDIQTIKDDVAKVFNNPEDASTYAGGALKFMKDLGLYRGNTTGNLLAKSAITRQDFALVLKSYHELTHK